MIKRRFRQDFPTKLNDNIEIKVRADEKKAERNKWKKEEIKLREKVKDLLLKEQKPATPKR